MERAVAHFVEDYNHRRYHEALQNARLVAFQKAALTGVPVYDVADLRAERGWENYVAVGEEIAPTV